MNCTDINTQIDDYLAAELNEQDCLSFEQHIAGCANCAQQVGDMKAMLSGLKQLPVPEPSINFEKRVFAEVRRQHKRQQQHHFVTGFATAMAASLAIWFGSTVFVPDAETVKPQEIISVALHETQTVRLMFDAQNDLDQVKLSIALPENMELEGYPGYRELAWETSLTKGQNVLALPVMAVGEGLGELVAQLNYGDKTKTFRVVLKTSNDGVMHYQLEPVRSA